jgi:endogenous inhibitor of DNA gyrase (YacG/DUF329 family)
MASKAPKPTVSERLKGPRLCPNCSGTVERKSPKGPMPIFCGKACKVEHNNRHMVEGRAVIAFLKAWRIDRGSGEIAQRAFAELCSITDQFNAADLAANRPRADYYAATILADGTRYFDRQRTR